MTNYEKVETAFSLHLNSLKLDLHVWRNTIRCVVGDVFVDISTRHNNRQISVSYAALCVPLGDVSLHAKDERQTRSQHSRHAIHVTVSYAVHIYSPCHDPDASLVLMSESFPNITENEGCSTCRIYNHGARCRLYTCEFPCRQTEVGAQDVVNKNDRTQVQHAILHA